MVLIAARTSIRYRNSDHLPNSIVRISAAGVFDLDLATAVGRHVPVRGEGGNVIAIGMDLSTGACCTALVKVSGYSIVAARLRD